MTAPTQKKAAIYRFGVFEADVRTRELSKRGVKVRLQHQPFQVLTALLERPRQLVTREELRQQIWSADTFVGYDHGLNTAINKLREVLGDSADTPRFIETLAKQGYRFLADVQVLEETAEIAPSPPAVTGAPDRRVLPQDTHKHESWIPKPVDDLPAVSRSLVRILFLLAQVMFLGFYIAALVNLEEVGQLLGRFFGSASSLIATVVLVTALVGIPVRLFLFTAMSFDDSRFRSKYERIFLAVLVLDVLWAVSPILTAHHIGIGLALAIAAALVYLPFGQRTLVRMAYR